jgi:K+-transporting ATPase ATPase A chain
VLYAHASVVNTNGSAFAGLTTNTPFYNLALALGMAMGRFLVIVPVLALAGSLAAKGRIPARACYAADHGRLVGRSAGRGGQIAGGLTYLPALAPGRRAHGDATRLGVLKRRAVWRSGQERPRET